MRLLSSFVGKLLTLLDKPRHFSRLLFFTVAVALLARFAVFGVLWPTWEWHNGEPPDQWNELAIDLVDYHTFGYFSAPNDPSVVRGPIFPIIEAPLYMIFGSNYAGWSVVLLLLDTFTCYLLIVTSRKLWGNRTALLAGGFYALNLPIIYYGAKIEQFISILPLVVIWLYLFTVWQGSYLRKWLPWVLGAVSGLMILNKTVYLPVPFVCSAALYWFNRAQINKVKHLFPIAIYCAVSVGVVAPWTIRNYVVTKGSIVPVQCMFWELVVQDIMYHDLDKITGPTRPDGELLKYWMKNEDAIAVADGLSQSPPATGRAKYEVLREKAYEKTAIRWIKEDPAGFVTIKLGNIWHYWVRGENWRKTRIFILMQTFYLGAAAAGLLVLFKYRQLGRIKYGLLLILVLWSEHILVWGWGRLSLDLVPVLALLFGLGVDTWMRRSQLGAASP
jgi:4-amino-4-deoxy-L-arabinose transferase-like glycosyltransferase